MRDSSADNHADTAGKTGEYRCKRRPDDCPVSVLWRYHAVYIPTQEDASVKEYLRMRDDHKEALKKIKQPINVLCLRHGHHYEGTTWTIKHVTWLRKLELPSLYRETLDEYMASFDEQDSKNRTV